MECPSTASPAIEAGAAAQPAQQRSRRSSAAGAAAQRRRSGDILAPTKAEKYLGNHAVLTGSGGGSRLSVPGTGERRTGGKGRDMGQQFVSYIRVSTAKQGQSGLGLEAQTKGITDYIASVGGAVIGTFTEIESGK